MPEVTKDPILAVEQLSERVLELERRVQTLEAQPQRPKTAASTPVHEIPATPTPAATWQGFPSPQMPATVPIIGKAVLGIAGAYLLRAIAESGAVPKIPIVVLAIAYAGWWMVLAIRKPEHRFASFVFAVTSVLILSPMLWESTASFGYLPPVFSGLVLAGFSAAVLHRTRDLDLQMIPWIAIFSTLVTALALIFATHDFVPLAFAILAIALATEVAACLKHHVGLRILPAIAADIAVWLTLYVYTSPTGVPEGFQSASPAALMVLWVFLLEIYVGSIAVRSFWLRRPITVVDTGQGAIVLAIAIFGAVRAPHALLVPALGVAFLVFAAFCYWGALHRFAGPDDSRNRRITGTWAAMLLLGGGILTFPSSVEVVFFSAMALVATLVYTRTAKLSLGLHASVFLLAAAVASGMPTYVSEAMTGTVPTAPGWQIWVTAIASAICYVIGSRHPEAKQARRALWITPATLLSCAVLAIAVVMITAFMQGRFDMAASRLSVVRTMANCVLALGLGVLGFQLKRPELGWMAYAAIGFGSLKLIFEDLRFGNPATLVLSLLFYGLILILLPRLTRRTTKALYMQAQH